MIKTTYIMISFSGRTWNVLSVNTDDLNNIKLKFDIDDLTAKIILNRGYLDFVEVEKYLEPKLKNSIPDPSLLLDMDKATDRIVYAISKSERIHIFGDYDVDGITSTALVVKYMRAIGMNVTYSLPNRFSDGYGLNNSAVENAISNNANLLIVVDSGTNSSDAVNFANDSGIDTIIIDHHMQLIDKLPDALAIVNPNRLDQDELDSAHIKNLSAAGVVYLLLISIQRSLKKIGYFKSRMMPDLLEYIDIAALGTLCDVMELKGINRALVKYLLNNNHKISKGLKTLLENFNISEISSPEDLTFMAGPAINSSGRLDDPHIGLNLLLCEDHSIAQRISSKLISLNISRKSIEKELLAEALCFIDEHNCQNSRGICVYGENWHEGVIGIIAGKLKDRFHKPSFVVSFDEEGLGKGSARSVPGFNIGEFFEKATTNKVIISGGGHALAGGFKLHKSQIESFVSYMNQEIKDLLAPSLNIDSILSIHTNLETVYKNISKLEPFGKGNEKPLFMFKELRISNAKKSSSGEHMTLYLTDRYFKGRLRANLFHISSKSHIVQKLEESKNNIYDIVGHISYIEQFGTSLIIEDMKNSV